MNQLYVYIYPLLGRPPAPSPPFWVITEPLTELPMLDSRFLLAICLTHGIDVSMSITVYQFSPNPTMSTHPLPTSAVLFLPCKWIHLYHFSRFHIHALTYIWFSLSDFTLYDRLVHCLKDSSVSLSVNPKLRKKKIQRHTLVFPHHKRITNLKPQVSLKI